MDRERSMPEAGPQEVERLGFFSGDLDTH